MLVPMKDLGLGPLAEAFFDGAYAHSQAAQIGYPYLDCASFLSCVLV